MRTESRLLISFRPGEIKDDLTTRTDHGAEDATGKLLSQTAQRDLERYYYLLRASLPIFSVNGALLICDVMNGTITEPHTASLLWANVADALDIDDPRETPPLAEKWQMDGDELVARLRKLTPFEQIAVADAAERFWNRVSSGIDESNEERARAVGLVR